MPLVICEIMDGRWKPLAGFYLASEKQRFTRYRIKSGFDSLILGVYIMSAKNSFQAITSGKFLTVSWVCRDGHVATYSARYGVKKYLKGTGKVRHNPDTHILVWCREQGGLRFNQPRLIARDSILAIKAEGFRVEVNICSPWAKMIQA